MSEFYKRLFHVSIVWSFYKLLSIYILVWCITTLAEYAPEKLAEINFQWWGLGGTALFLFATSFVYVWQGKKIDEAQKVKM